MKKGGAKFTFVASRLQNLINSSTLLERFGYSLKCYCHNQDLLFNRGNELYGFRSIILPWKKLISCLSSPIFAIYGFKHCCIVTVKQPDRDQT